MTTHPPPRSPLFPYTTLFRSLAEGWTWDGELPHGDRAVVRRVLLHDGSRSEEHTSELQSHSDLVCRLLLEKKNSQFHQSPACIISHVIIIVSQALQHPSGILR